MLHNEARKLLIQALEKTHNAREVAENFSVNRGTYNSPFRAVSLLRKNNRRVVDTGNGCADPTNQNIESFTKRTDGLRC